MPEPIKLPYSTAKGYRQQERLLSDTTLRKAVGLRLNEPTIQSYVEYLHLKFGCPFHFMRCHWIRSG